MQKLEFVYELDTVESVNVWEKLAPIIEKKEALNFIIIDGVKVKSSNILVQLIRLNEIGFDIETDNFNLHMGIITRYKLIFVQVEIKKTPEKKWYEEWVHELVRLEGFVHANLSDSAYVCWQSMHDPVFYDLKNKSYTQLPMIHNGLPDPVGRMVIDVSNNPGLRDIRKGYIEAIGARMWFSEKFLALINRTIEEIQDAYPCKIEKYNEDVYQLSASVGIFKDSSTEAEQRQLRAALYGNVRQEE